MQTNIKAKVFLVLGYAESSNCFKVLLRIKIATSTFEECL